MWDADPFSAERLMHHKVREEHRRADARRLARLLAPRRPAPFSRSLRWPVCKLGYWLVSAGAWLERQSVVRPRQLEAKPSRGR